MNIVIARLSAWHRLYLQLQDARARLKASQAARDGAASLGELEAEVSRLQQESDSQLEGLQGLAVSKRVPGA